METAEPTRRRPVSHNDHLALSPHMRDEHQPAAKQLERLCSRRRSKRQSINTIVNNRYQSSPASGPEDEAATSMGESTASELDSQRDEKTFTTEQQDEVIHVVDLMNMVRLTFKDQQLEADYQVHCRQHIR